MLRESVVAIIAAFVAFGSLKSKYYDRYYKTQLLEEYDYIIVGAGTSGSVVANRLSEDPNTTVLVLEAGGSGRGNAYIDIPYFASRLPGRDEDWFFFSTPQPELANNRLMPYTRGKVAGGSSALNYMVYNRGNTQDYDEWERSGADGWAFNDVKKYFKRVERAVGGNLPNSLGRNGSLSLTQTNVFDKFYQFLSGSIQELGYKAVDALEHGGIVEGVSKTTFTILNGIRQNAAMAYLWPIYDERRDRLHFSFHSLVHKILLSPTPQGVMRAHGVRFDNGGVVRDVRARKEVIVCAGAFNSPQILMLSGIGPKDQLRNLNISVIVDLPGVGQNLQDHPSAFTYFYGDKFPRDMTKSEDETLEQFLGYLQKEESDISAPSLTQSGLAFFRLDGIDDKIVKPRIPIVQYTFSSLRLSEKPLLWPLADADKVADIIRRQNNTFMQFEILAFMGRLKSRGEVTLATNKPTDRALIDHRIFSHLDDLRVMIEALKFLEKFENTKGFQDYGVHMVPYPFCDEMFGSEKPRSDEYYECYLRQAAFMVFHACCTNKMGRDDDAMSVLDAKLRVRGVQGLRVADASVMPDVTSGNTQAACYMIGEKAADMIINE